MLRIAVVDDYPAFRGIVGGFIRDHCHELGTLVAALASRDDTVAQLSALKPDVILLDIGVPGRFDLSLVAPLRTALPDVVIVATGSLDYPGYREAAHAARIDHYLEKSDLPTQLLPLLARLGAGVV